MAVDYDLLEAYLDGEENEHGLDFAATHGFLCATVVGPELKDWLNHLFDGQAATVPAPVLEAVKNWQEAIRQTLANDELIELPFEIEEAEVDSSLGDWSVGFVDALFLNEDNDWYDIEIGRAHV